MATQVGPGVGDFVGTFVGLGVAFVGGKVPIIGALVGFSLGLDVGSSVVGETVGSILVTDGDGVIEAGDETLHVSAERSSIDSKPISKRKFGSFTGASFNIAFT